MLDLELVDPEAFEKRVVYIRDCDRTALEDLTLTLTDDCEPAVLYESPAAQNACVELKEGGSKISVTEENKAQSIQFLVEHRFVGAIRPQIAAFRNGLGVFVTRELRRNCGVAQPRPMCSF
jgi:hypothetical protein